MTGTLAMMRGHCTCEPCELGDETCSRASPCEACKATIRLGERWTAGHYLGLSAEHWDSLPEGEQQAVLAAWRAGWKQAEAGLVRDILEALCRRDGLPLESADEPGEPARNHDLAGRLGIGHVFGLKEQP